jgi:hypothetical protein
MKDTASPAHVARALLPAAFDFAVAVDSSHIQHRETNPSLLG